MRRSAIAVLALAISALLFPAAADADIGPACIWQIGPAGNSQTEVMFRATDSPSYFALYGLRKQFNGGLSNNVVTGGVYVLGSQLSIGWDVFPNPGTPIAEKAGGNIDIDTLSGNGYAFHVTSGGTIPFSYTWNIMGGACGSPYSVLD